MTWHDLTWQKTVHQIKNMAKIYKWLRVNQCYQYQIWALEICILGQVNTLNKNLNFCNLAKSSTVVGKLFLLSFLSYLEILLGCLRAFLFIHFDFSSRLRIVIRCDNTFNRLSDRVGLMFSDPSHLPPPLPSVLERVGFDSRFSTVNHGNELSIEPCGH